MSRFHKADIICPRCLNETSETIWDVIRGDQDPDLKEQLLTKSLLALECGNCGTTNRVQYPMLYRDDTAQLLLYLNPDAESPASASGGPEAGGLPDIAGYTLRLVSNINELLEKIHCFDHALDDRALELVKIALCSQPQHGHTLTDLRFVHLDEDDRLIFLAITAGGDPAYLPVDRQMLRNASQLLEQLPQSQPKSGWLTIGADWAKACWQQLMDRD